MFKDSFNRRFKKDKPNTQERKNLTQIMRTKAVDELKGAESFVIIAVTQDNIKAVACVNKSTHLSPILIKFNQVMSDVAEM